MKRLFLTTLCVLFIGMFTSTAQYRYVRSVARRVYSEQAAKGDHYARYKLSAMSIRCEYCIHSGAYVRHGNKFCFSMTNKLLNLFFSHIFSPKIYPIDKPKRYVIIMVEYEITIYKSVLVLILKMKSALFSYSKIPL